MALDGGGARSTYEVGGGGGEESAGAGKKGTDSEVRADLETVGRCSIAVKRCSNAAHADSWGIDWCITDLPPYTSR